MAVFAIAPFIFLSKYGRQKMGMTMPKKYKWLLIAFVSGLAASLLL